jgi:glycosyltransferase involved in cell wall biosynthesis
MSKNEKGVLILTPFFSPNIGGVETHLDDLVSTLDEKGYNVFVQTYSPITTPGVPWKKWEKKGNNIFITRYKWFGKDLFHKLENYPLLDFLYITPYLLIRVLFFMFLNNRKIEIIHAQGLNAAVMGIVLKKIFRKKLVVSLHAVYELNSQKTSRVIKSILLQADVVLGMSQVILKQFESSGFCPTKLMEYKYWIDTQRFKPVDQKSARNKTGIKDNFTVLFVGRLIKKKGADLLLDIAKRLENIQFYFIGSGPEESAIKLAARNHANIFFLGGVSNSDLHIYYNSADIYCIPSVYEEGFGRVGMEAVACGIPVVGSNRGGIGEALDETVSLLVEPSVENLKKIIIDLYSDREKLLKLKKNCRNYALKNFSKENIELILKHY